MSFSPNLQVLSNWRQTVTVAFQQLRRVAFLVESIFSWGDFDPQINWNGMAATGVGIYRARYLRIYKFLWFGVDFGATLAAPFTSQITITIPSTLPNDPTALHAAGALVEDAGVFAVGYWYGIGGTNLLNFRKGDTTNFAAGAGRVTCNGFIEII